jgi:uncharacterized protein YbjT (DUF2867 family)
LKIAIAGATGFVGRALARRLAEGPEGHRVVALTRAAGPRPPEDRLTFRSCDLFSARETEEALAGCDAAVYLVHSMLPSARLTQASFADLDLILADNFARAAGKAALRRVVYLGGILPADDLSAHLESRREVEETFRRARTPFVALRAGLVIGADGSSFQILEKLVRRLPVMLLPAWTRTPTQPIALTDVVELLARTLDAPGAALEGETFDVGGPEVTDYAGLLAATAQAQGLVRRTLPVRWFSPGLSTLWVCLITGAPRELVKPLVQSLRHRMVAGDRRLQERLGVPGLGLREALAQALRPRPARVEAPPPGRTLSFKARRGSPENDVRSVQRLPLPPEWTAEDVAQAFTHWLPAGFRPFLSIGTDASGEVRFGVRGLRWPLLVLHHVDGRSTPDRQVFRVTGGLLARTGGPRQGRLEFRAVLGGAFVLAAIHDFTPTLPWYVYKATQAQVHLWVMRAFGRFLGARTAAERPTAAEGDGGAGVPQPAV